MTAATGASSSSFSDILNKLVKEEQLAQTIEDFSNGFLCSVCKEFVYKIDRLQQELVDVKSSVVQLIKNNECFEKERGVESVKKENLELIHQAYSGLTITKIKSQQSLETSESEIENEEIEEECNFVSKAKKNGHKSTDAFVRSKRMSTETPKTMDYETVQIDAHIEKGEEKIVSNKKKNGHESLNTIIRPKRISKETPKLKEYKTMQVNADKEKVITTINEEVPDEVLANEDEVYNVEALLEKRGYKYLVKWENFPVSHNSWEPRFGLPQHIVEV